tara:strand:+ start:12121 stop:15222 length:3102 start_codon:yes stop_codon:yes gene_type:complete
MRALTPEYLTLSHILHIVLLFRHSPNQRSLASESGHLLAWGYWFVLVIALTGCQQKASNHPSPIIATPERSRGSVPGRLQEAERHLSEGRSVSALQLVHQILRDTPENPQALELAIKIHSGRDEFAEAADYGTRLAQLSSQDASAILIRCFDWNLRAGRYEIAEANLLRAIEVAPNDIDSRRLLVNLYNAQGRRVETRTHVEQLIRCKAVSWEETLSLIDLRGPFTLVTFDSVIDDSQASLFWLGKMRMAYEDFRSDRGNVIATVKRVVDKCPNSAAAHAFYGRLLVENGRYQALKLWSDRLPDDTLLQPEYWTTVGAWLQHQGRHQEAIRAYGEALHLDSGNREALRELIRSLDSIGAEEQAVALREQLAVLDQIFRLARKANTEQAMWIATELQKLSRPWEALAWMKRSAQLAGRLGQIIPELDRRSARVIRWEGSASTDQIAQTRLRKLLGFDIHDWPMPELDELFQDPKMSMASTSRDNSAAGVPEPLEPLESALRFDDIASASGLDIDIETGFFDEDGFYAYQVDGSGLGVLDYDLDGLPDLYIMQAGGLPNDPIGSDANQLFRQVQGHSFHEVTEETRTGDRSYGAGVAVGDLNQDGFPDLLLGNVGASVLLINQGDGSFRNASHLIQENPTVWTSSFAIADLSGDHLPELVQVNYIDDKTAFEIRCSKDYSHCQPQRFRTAADRVLKGNSDGTFSTWKSLRAIDNDPKLGLGVVVANFDKQYGNDFFVANDGDLNHYWVSTSNEDNTEDRFGMIELAGLRGCSIGQGGGAQACMGIAAGDFNRDGILDMLITNFYHEPVNLFIQNRLGFFSDQATQYALKALSMPVLGFGAQARDFDNDGWLDLVMLNGHVYDATDQGIPFLMRSQLMKGSRSGFALTPPEVAGTYFQREQLGRALAVWDYNCDGRMDLVANHLDQPVAVLQNNSNSLNWLQLELVGTRSERDAIGAVVTVVTADSQSWTAFRTAGDGYRVSNEPVLHFGVGHAESLQRVEVTWPSGQTQSFDHVPSNARYLLIEDSSTLYCRNPE